MPRGVWRTKNEPARWHINHDWHFSNSCVEFSYGAIVRAMCKLHQLTGEHKPLEFAGRLVKFMIQSRMWAPDSEPKGVISSEHGHFDGHLHAYCWRFWGLLDYAEITNDARLKAFIRDGYEYGRNFGISRIDLYLEGCAVGDMKNLAVRLSESGIADYWEDVDRYVRNHLMEIQLLETGPVQQVCEKSRPHQTRSFDSSEDAIEKNVGAVFADTTRPTVATPGGIY